MEQRKDIRATLSELERQQQEHARLRRRAEVLLTAVEAQDRRRETIPVEEDRRRRPER